MWIRLYDVRRRHSTTLLLLLQPFTLQSHIRFADAVQARVASASEIHGDMAIH
jgi:hypothetical protein